MLMDYILTKSAKQSSGGLVSHPRTRSHNEHDQRSSPRQTVCTSERKLEALLEGMFIAIDWGQVRNSSSRST